MIVVKVGGSAGIDYESVCDDVAELVQQDYQIVLVHGGSDLTNRVATKLGHPPQFITSPSGYSSRMTDKETLEIFMMVYCGKVNKEIVELLQKRSINALGLAGVDGRIWVGPRKKAIRAVENGRVRIIRDSYTGRVEQVNSSLLRVLLDEGIVPVLTPPAISYEGEAINVDGDRAAAATAVALQATDLLILSNIPGVLRDYPEPASLVRTIDREQIEFATKNYAQGRMRIKLMGAKEALAGGVSRVVLGDARSKEPIQNALAGQGTVIQ
ncbi:MAG: [LysW]-aminoadipate kinase [Candidatus Promineifilaceae bacterium]|nr:[LysW]-aminoadipate kinase [Candidatus Promineifilaceae bacterium]